MDFWTIVASIISAICFCLVGGCYYYENVFSYWQKKGVGGPKAWPVFGNFATVLLSNRMELETNWARKYGKVYGVYQGNRPALVIADPEVFIQICIKDFDAFTDHHPNEFLNEYQKNFLFFLPGDHWKKVRALMSPTFTSGKIKRMFKFLDRCADDLVQCFNEQLSLKDSIVNLKDTYNLYTLDGIATCCYGLKLERAGSASLKTAATRNHFVEVALKTFDINMLRILALVVVPNFIKRYFGFEIISSKNFEPLASVMSKMIDSRRKSPKKLDDYLQLLIEAKLNDKVELDEMDLQENHHAGLTHESLLEDQKKMVEEVQSRAGCKDVALSDLEILVGGVFLLSVGLETTGTLLSSCSYTLAFHQDIQQRLYDELRKIAEYDDNNGGPSFTYEALTSCQYLDAVISETLRRLPPILMFDRVSNRDYHLKKYNIDLPKGSIVNLSYSALLHDPDNWEEPLKFNPERFMPGNKEKIVPGSYCPFGMGPRHCLGMRFSLTEAKLALAKIVMNFRFEPAPNTAFPPKPKSPLTINNIKNPIVKLIPRIS